MLKNYFKSEFNKNVTTLFTGTVIAQIIPFIFSPIISRLYLPEDFGFMGLVYGTIAMTLSPILNFRYEQAIILPKEDRVSITLIILSFISTVMFTVVFLIISILYNQEIILFFKEQRLRTWIFIVPFFLIFVGFQTPLNYWLIRKKAFKATAYNKIAQTSIIIFSAVTLSFFEFEGNLIIAYLLGWTVYFVFTYYQSIKKGIKFISIKQSELIATLKEYKNFPIYNILPTILITVCQLFIPVLYLQQHFNTETVGYYTHVRQYTLIPLSLLSVALSQVLLESISSKIRNKKSIFPFLKKLLFTLIIIYLPVYVIIKYFGHELFALIFSEAWTTAGDFAEILIIGFVVQTFATPFGQIIIAVNKIKLSILFPTIYFILLISLFFIELNEIKSTLWFITISEVVAYLVYLFISLYLAFRYEKSIK